MVTVCVQSISCGWSMQWIEPLCCRVMIPISGDRMTHHSAHSVVIRSLCSMETLEWHLIAVRPSTTRELTIKTHVDCVVAVVGDQRDKSDHHYSPFPVVLVITLQCRPLPMALTQECHSPDQFSCCPLWMIGLVARNSVGRSCIEPIVPLDIGGGSNPSTTTTCTAAV